MRTLLLRGVGPKTRSHQSTKKKKGMVKKTYVLSSKTNPKSQKRKERRDNLSLSAKLNTEDTLHLAEDLVRGNGTTRLIVLNGLLGLVDLGGQLLLSHSLVVPGLLDSTRDILVDSLDLLSTLGLVDLGVVVRSPPLLVGGSLVHGGDTRTTTTLGFTELSVLLSLGFGLLGPLVEGDGVPVLVGSRHDCY